MPMAGIELVELAGNQALLCDRPLLFEWAASWDGCEMDVGWMWDGESLLEGQ